jgi:hypothetical protein
MYLTPEDSQYGRKIWCVLSGLVNFVVVDGGTFIDTWCTISVASGLMAACRADVNGVVSTLNSNSRRRNQDIH